MADLPRTGQAPVAVDVEVGSPGQKLARQGHEVNGEDERSGTCAGIGGEMRLEFADLPKGGRGFAWIWKYPKDRTPTMTPIGFTDPFGDAISKVPK